jgi:hypothetical protein
LVVIKTADIFTIEKEFHKIDMVITVLLLVLFQMLAMKPPEKE